MERNTKHRRKRREQGLCGWEGCLNHSGINGPYYCLKHREIDRLNHKLRRMKLAREAIAA